MILLSNRVYMFMSQIPRGKVTTYKALAQACNTKAYRAIGQICKRNPNVPRVPCHRVIKSNGKIGGYAFGIPKKIALLKKERVTIVNGKIDLKRFGCQIKPVAGHW